MNCVLRMLPQVNKVDILVCGVEVICAEGWLGHGREYPIYSGQGIAQMKILHVCTGRKGMIFYSERVSERMPVELY